MLLHAQKRLVRFDVFAVDPASGELWKAGRRIRLQNQPRQVLRMLVARRGELVTREELRRALWRDETFVDFDNGLNVAVRKIRGALGDPTPSPRFIETERAQGYRFIAPAIEEPAEVSGGHAPCPTEPITLPGDLAAGQTTGVSRVAQARASLRRRRLFGKDGRWSSRRQPAVIVLVCAALAAAGVSLWRAGGLSSSASTSNRAPEPISLAVLPLSSSSGESEAFLAAGIPDAVITRLSGIRRFRLRPWSAVARYRGQGVDPQEAGRGLGARYVLAGSIRATADRVRVSVQLVDTIGGTSVWADRFDVPRGNLLSVEDAVAEQIASALRVQMPRAERERFYRRYTRNGAAYERYLMGRARLRSVTEDDALQAIAEFEAARDLDPDYALAYAGLATAAAQLRVRFASRDDANRWDSRARQEAGRALQLDPDLAEAHVALAAVHRFQEYDWDTVIHESIRALHLNPSLDIPHLYLATAYFHIGLLDQAESAVTAARRLNPENRVEPLEILGAVKLFSGSPAEAIGHLSQVQDLSDSRIVRYLLGWTLYYQDEQQRAEAMLEPMLQDDGPLAGNAGATLAALRAARGRTAEARALADRVASRRDLIHHGAYGLGTAYAQLRDATTALRWLNQAVTTGFSCYPWYERDPLLDPIRGDRRFAAFMRDLRRSWEDAQAKYGRAPQD
jgi:TolB-like protein/DNA-binding winged helix-turn-helix (wHTH) protein